MRVATRSETRDAGVRAGVGGSVGTAGSGGSAGNGGSAGRGGAGGIAMAGGAGGGGSGGQGGARADAAADSSAGGGGVRMDAASGGAGGKRGAGGTGGSVGRDMASDPPPPPPPPRDMAGIADQRPPGMPGSPPVAYWKLDEGQGTTVADSMRAGNEGTLVNGPTWSVEGFAGAKFTNPASLSFDGTDDRVELGDKAIPQVEETKSVSLWVKYDVVPMAGRQCFVALINRTLDVGLHIGLRLGRVQAWNYAGTEYAGAVAPAAGWHHIGYVFNGMTHTLYVDGTPTSAAMPAQAGPVSTARLGSCSSSGMDNFKGLIDDVRIFDRALSAAEMGTLRAGL